MAQYVQTYVFDKSGAEIWSGAFNDRYKALDLIPEKYKTVALGFVLGLKDRLDGKTKLSGKQIFNKAIDYGFINVDGNLPGLVTVLPKAKIIEKIVEKSNADHFKSLNAVEVTFPTFFDFDSKEMQYLARSYEKEDRMFSLGGQDENVRVSYAADPGYFLWLKDKVFKDNSLPYAVHSQQQFFRRFKGGELGDFTRIREFPGPDLHILCQRDQAKDLYIDNTTISAERMRFLLGDEWCYAMDMTSELFAELGNDFVSDICEAIDSICVVNILEERPRYYGIKSVFMMDAGDCAIMNFNMQWDEENPKLFNIRNESNDNLVVLHGTLMHSWYKIIPVFLNKVLIDKDLSSFPYKVAPLQVALIPVNDDCLELAEETKARLIKNNVRCQVILPKKNISKALKIVRKNLVPYYGVIGDKEKTSGVVELTSDSDNKKVELEEFIENMSCINEATPVMFFGRYDTEDLF